MILVIDTSLSGAQMALVDDHKIVWKASQRENSGSLIALSNLWLEAGVAVEALNGLAVGVGPGSFTGIKIGLAFAYGLAASRPLEHPIPMLGDSALAAAAESLRRFYGLGSVGLLLPATKTHGFFAFAGEDPNEYLINTAPKHEYYAPEATVHERFSNLPSDSGVWVIGSWPAMEEALKQYGRSFSQLSMQDAFHFSLDELCRRACSKFPKEYSQKLPEPRYLRLSTAEEALHSKK